MHDTSLDELCRVRPRTLSELRGVSGFGDKKTELYGQGILDALTEFARGSRAAKQDEEKVKPAEETMRLLAEGRTFEEIAKARGRQVSSVVSLVVSLMEKGELEFQGNWDRGPEISANRRGLRTTGNGAAEAVEGCSAAEEYLRGDKTRSCAAAARTRG